MKPNKRLHLQKQTLRLLLDNQLSLAVGGTATPDTRGPSPTANNNPCDTSLCIVPVDDTSLCASTPCGTTDTRGG